MGNKDFKQGLIAGLIVIVLLGGVGVWVTLPDSNEYVPEYLDEPDRNQVLPHDYNDSGMSYSAPSLDSGEWKDQQRVKILDVREGKGAGCPEDTTLTVHYTGWLKDGTQFETSRKGDPMTQFLSSLIVGWHEGIPGMKVGGIRRIYIPYPIAYGDSAKPGIPAKSDLFFEIKLLSFSK